MLSLVPLWINDVLLSLQKFYTNDIISTQNWVVLVITMHLDHILCLSLSRSQEGSVAFQYFPLYQRLLKVCIIKTAIFDMTNSCQMAYYCVPTFIELLLVFLYPCFCVTAVISLFISVLIGFLVVIGMSFHELCDNFLLFIIQEQKNSFCIYT